jgi:hypothetical protein
MEARAIWAYLCAKFMSASRGEEGSVVEKVILTAIFAAAAIAVGTLIVTKIREKANSLNLN